MNCGHFAWSGAHASAQRGRTPLRWTLQPKQQWHGTCLMWKLWGILGATWCNDEATKNETSSSDECVSVLLVIYYSTNLWPRRDPASLFVIDRGYCLLHCIELILSSILSKPASSILLLLYCYAICYLLRKCLLKRKSFLPFQPRKSNTRHTSVQGRES